MPEAAMEAVEEARTHLLPPGERASHLSSSREKACSDKMVAGQMKERRVQGLLESQGQCRLPGAGCAVEQDDAAPPRCRFWFV
jgi:hypothetical protein